MPEPLNKVLEPVSVLHLDMMDDIVYHETEEAPPRGFTRHGSVGTMEDPGIIGPVVWNMHRQRLQHGKQTHKTKESSRKQQILFQNKGVSVDEGMEDLQVTSSVARMRKRFHDLLDDTFSLFGSRRGSPVEQMAADNNR